MKKFLLQILSSIIGTSIVFLIAPIIIGIIVLAVYSSSITSDRITTISENTVLKISLDNKVVVDNVQKNAVDYLISEMISDSDRKVIGLDDIVSSIEKAKTDSHIVGIELRSGNPKAGFTQLKSIRDKLKEFKQGGKFIFSYSEQYTNKGYYLSSVSDKVFLNPLGMLDWRGLYTHILFFKRLQNNIGIHMNVFRQGKFKGAAEPFLNEKLSEENKLQIQRMLDLLWKDVLVEVSESRNISVDKLDDIAEEVKVKFPSEAEAEMFIDQIAYEDEFIDKIKNEVGTSVEVKKVSLEDYVYVNRDYYSVKKDKIAILYAQGNIHFKEGSEKYEIGHLSFIKAIRDIADDDNIKAVVLRVNSTGGSPLASELIWRELMLLKRKKPLYVSMGDFAASGGYYISTAADKIIASSSTITGSIGVFAVIPNAENFFGLVGITTDSVVTNKNSFVFNISRGATKNHKKEIEQQLDNIYDTFIDRVSKGRGINKKAVDEIAQGRIWVGKDALEKKLVDALGNLDDAVKMIATASNLDNYSLVNYPKVDPKDFFSSFLHSVKTMAKFNVLSPELKQYLDIEKKMKDNKIDIKAQLPFEIEIK
ncbi:signal peptide peptidase SppA [Ichthyobacterium seriolicida]|uniref:Signal peptide peptidase SppA n=1 Tax=Ichthyobacterium seriolicida TaxID=242600 RepID=A0A1J1E4R6_9FLAO|nr:signal peptide peptidase SppA [Ichthyobacterium seriolicida]BAV95044.1 signal peptide peptidase SppA [Ichthyobacterium seriolicida]